MGRWKCPMCGRAGRQTKEHVWPKWLRQSPMAKNLLANAHGERMPYEYADLCIENGRVVAVPKNVNAAKLVPQITAPVCSKCNNGWMSISGSLGSENRHDLYYCFKEEPGVLYRY